MSEEPTNAELAQKLDRIEKHQQEKAKAQVWNDLAGLLFIIGAGLIVYALFFQR